MSSNSEPPVIVISGTVEFIWTGPPNELEYLVAVDPDDPRSPSTFEISSEMLSAPLTEGQRVRIAFTPEPHEVVDPDSATTSMCLRPHITSVTVID